MRIIPYLFILVAAFLMGCTSMGKKLNHVSIGMSKAEVIAAMGTPTSTSAENNVEILRYSLNASRAMWSYDFDDYYVKLVGGKVESYGKWGDYEKQHLR